MRRKLTDEEKAARKAKHEATKKEKERLADIKRKEDNLNAALERERESLAFYPDRKPTVFYKKGDKAQYGSHNNTEILEVLDDGKIYLIRCFGMRKKYNEMVPYEEKYYVPWHSLFRFRSEKSLTSPIKFLKEEDIHIVYSQRDIRSLLHQFHYAGCDINPDYQRGNVWEMEDKIKLLDSIFNNIDIGKFTFIELPYVDKYTPHVEILDGKQRMMAIVDFYEGRYKYKGYYFHELHGRDQAHFRSYSISWGLITNNPTKKQKYEYFLKLNTGGKPVEESHLDKVREMWRNA